MDEKILIQTPWFLTNEKVFDELKTSPKGLSEEEAGKRLKLFGDNKFKNRKQISILQLAIRQIMSPLIFILIGAAVLTGILQEWINMGVIIVAIFINAGLGLYREYQAENTLEKLVTYIKERSRVIRGGLEKEIDSSLLVPGDIIKLSYGSRVPADARIISSNNFKVDESVLTGESAPVEKDFEVMKGATLMADRLNMVYAGTLVVEGFSLAIVTGTGFDTEIGKIADLVSSTERAKTPIQKGVGELSWYIFILTIFIVIGILVLGILRGEPLIQMLVIAAAVAVGTVPEALPIALTVILSIGAERIASKKGVVRKLSAAETLGSTTLIMTDKTGTLTKADMQLVGVYPFNNLIKENFTDSELIRLSQEQKDVLELSLKNIDVLVQNTEEEEKAWNFTGRPFEVNIARASALHNIPLKKILLEENNLYLPFNSSNKFSISKNGDDYTIMGAPDILLKMSNLDKDSYLKIMSWIEEASNDGKRLISIGTFKSKNIKDLNSIKDIKFEGILSFFDPIRKEVPSAIKNIESHGVKVVIITGDLKGTALSVAKSLGWEVKEDEVLTGEDLHSMTDIELLGILNKIKVFARVTPEDKLRVGNLYRQQGEVVAMTGDGVNDAPALKSMDIGVSLGSGSDVAQSASDLVLLDDNFQTIGMAIDEGRRILANIRKTFIYLMSNSLDEVFVIGGSLIVNIALPLNALQIIWVNLFTGSLPAVAFAYDDNFDKDVKKIGSKNGLLNTEVKIMSFGIGMVSSILVFLLYYYLLKIGFDLKVARSVFFACFSVYVLIISFSLRSLYKPIFSYNPFSNKKLNIAVLIGLGILISSMTIPFMQDIFNIDPMPLSLLWLVVGWGLFNILIVELAKWIFRYRLKINQRKLSYPQ